MSNKILVGVIIILVLAEGYFAWNNWLESRERDDATLVVKLAGEAVGQIDLASMKQLGSEEFSVVLRSSGQSPRENNYTGVALSAILEAVQPDILDGREQVTVTALDGFAVVYSVKELRQPEHIYLVWARDGQPLAGKGQGDMGPLLIIARQDQFGQRWCKFATGVDIR